MLQTFKEPDIFGNTKKVSFSENTPLQTKEVNEKYMKKEHSQSTDKMPLPRSLILHRKNKSNDYNIVPRLELPSVKDILARILSSSSSPSKSRKEYGNEEMASLLPKYMSNFSPSKNLGLRKKQRHLTKSHYRNSSPLKPFNDRIFHLKRLIGNPHPR